RARVRAAYAGSWRLAEIQKAGLADDTPRALARRRCRGGPRGSFQAAGRDFQARHCFLAGHGGYAAGPDRIEERNQIGAQRFIMADREMAHRVAAVRLETEAFG